MVSIGEAMGALWTGTQDGMQECEPSFPLLQLEPLLWVRAGGNYQVRTCTLPDVPS